MRVAGVDAALGGWVAVVLQGGRFEDAQLFPDFDELTATLGDAAAIGVDIPIGLPSEGRRRADIEARSFIGARRSSVFFAPARPVFDEVDYAAARRRHRGISAQSWALRRAILDVERYAQDARIHEVHPEVSFRALAGRELPFGKRSWNGQQLRLKLLRATGIELAPTLAAGRAPTDDLIDAAVVAWSAGRIARGEAKTLPADAGPGEPTISY